MEKPSRNRRRFSLIASFLITILGISVIIGWILDIDLLKSVFPGFATMKINTALGLTLSGISLNLLIKSGNNSSKRIAVILSFLVLILGGLTISQELFHYNLGIDHLFSRGWSQNISTPGEIAPGRMSPLTALCFILLGASFMGLATKNNKFHVLSQVLLNIVTFLSFTAILGYLFNVPQFYKLAFLASVALHTAISFLILSIAGSFIYPSLGITGIFTGNNIGSRMARLLFTQLTIAILILTYLRMLSQRYNVISVEFGIALYALSFIVICLFLIWRAYIALNRIEDKKTIIENDFLKLSSFLNATPDPIVIVDEQGIIKLINDQTESVFGYSKDDLVGQSVEVLMPNRFRAKHVHHRKSFVTAPKARSMGSGMRLFATKKDGGELPVEVSLNPVKIQDKTWVTAAIRDVSERIENEAELKEISDRLKLTTYYSSIGIWDYDLINDHLVWDDFMFELYGVKKENFSGAFDAWQSVLHPDDIEQGQKEVQMALSGEKDFDTEFRIIWPDNSIHYLKGRAIVQRDESGKPIRMLGTNWDITFQKLAESEIKESNKRNRIFVEQAPIAMAMFDKNMCYMAASQQWIIDYDLSDVQIIGQSHYDIFPEIGEEWKKIHQECLQGATNQVDEADFIRENGTIQWLTWDIRPWYINEKSIGGLIVYTADITQVKQKEQEKRNIEEILEKTNEVARIGAWEVNLEEDRILWSNMIKEIHEVPDDYVPELTAAMEFFKEGDSQNIIQNAVSEAIENGTPYDIEVELVTAKGNVVWVRSIGQAEFVDGKCKRLYGVFQDIDQIKRSEQLLNRANQELNAIFNSGPVAIIVTDINGLITHFNRGAEEMLQYSADEMIGKQTPEPLHLMEEIVALGEEFTSINGYKISGFDAFAELAQVDNDETREWTYVRKDGTTFKALLTLATLKDEKGNITGFLGMAIDISEKVKSQQKLIEAKKDLEILAKKLTSQNAQLVNFAHITSHNLRSPVSNLSSLLYLYNSAETDADRKMIFEKFDTVIEHLTSTLNSLIESLKIQKEGNQGVEDIVFEEVLKKNMEIVSAQIMETNAKITYDFSNATQINYNRNYLESILLNLLTNAIKYRDPERPPVIEFKTDIVDDRVVLTVKDNGLGINLSRHGKKLFGLHKVFHRHPEAKGVGLYLTKTQIETMGGTIAAESEVGKGTKFTIKF